MLFDRGSELPLVTVRRAPREWGDLLAGDLKRWLTTKLQACIAFPSSDPVAGSWLRIAALLSGMRVWLFETCGMETGVPAELCRVMEARSKAGTLERSTMTC